VTYFRALISALILRWRVLLVLVGMVVRHLSEINWGRGHLGEYGFALAVDSGGLSAIDL
jgi:hypothetical protein